MDNKGRILIIEDVEEFQKMLHHILAHKYELKILDNGNNIIQQIKSFKPNLILLDINLPGMSGFEICSMIQNECGLGSTSIIFLSSRSKMSDKIMGLSLGADDYICKPF